MTQNFRIDHPGPKKESGIEKSVDQNAVEK
jgi:hypothetical protein